MRIEGVQGQSKFQITSRMRYVFSALGVLIFMASYANHFSYKYNDLVDVSMYHLSVYPIFYLLSLRIFRERPSLVEWITFVSGLLGLIGMVTIQFL
jgi:drug/metabolite transporter (DMT)-like permease